MPFTSHIASKVSQPFSAPQEALASRFTAAGQIPIIGTSGVTGDGTEELMEAVCDVYRKWNTRWGLCRPPGPVEDPLDPAAWPMGPGPGEGRARGCADRRGVGCWVGRSTSAFNLVTPSPPPSPAPAASPPTRSCASLASWRRACWARAPHLQRWRASSSCTSSRPGACSCREAVPRAAGKLFGKLYPELPGRCLCAALLAQMARVQGAQLP